MKHLDSQVWIITYTFTKRNIIIPTNENDE